MTLIYIAKCPFCGSDNISEQNTIEGFSCQDCLKEFDENSMILEFGCDTKCH